jgi:uncharacterized UBP type Zn finger protein
VKSLKQRFFDKIITIPEHSCYEWIAYKHPKGYGKIQNKNGSRVAHRIAYELYYGPFNKNNLICHKCDNPGCVRPEHLFMGTAQDNNKDRDNKGRQAKGESQGFSKLTSENVRKIIELVKLGEKSNADIARMFNVNRSLISNILSGLIWSHVTGINNRWEFD